MIFEAENDDDGASQSVRDDVVEVALYGVVLRRAQAAVEDGDLQVSETARALLDVWDPEHGEGANAAVAPIADESSQEEGAFALLLKSADPMDRILAVRASYATHGEAAIGMLGRLLVSDPDVEVIL